MSPLRSLAFLSLMRRTKARKQRQKYKRKKTRSKVYEYFFEFLLSVERRVFTCTVASLFTVASSSRKLWVAPRSHHWWRFIANGTFTDSDWLHHIRMTQTTFMYLVNALRDHITKANTSLRDAIDAERRVAITLRRLATNVEYRTIAQLFGVGISTVCTVVHQVNYF